MPISQNIIRGIKAFQKAWHNPYKGIEAYVTIGFVHNVLLYCVVVNQWQNEWTLTKNVASYNAMS